MIPIDEMASFCKKKGFIYPNSEIYGAIAGFFDYGPYGVELKNNIKNEWWKYHVKQREDIIGIDGSIITNPKVWEASGHVSNFADLMLVCSKCKAKVRADQFIEEKLNIQADGISADEINKIVEKNDLRCPKCNSKFEKVKDFNLMFTTNIGPDVSNESKAYLRPETAQLIFTDFRLAMDNARKKLPFGIAQMGKSFRNEISPRNFLFRCREFEQMEIEYFIHPNQTYHCPYVNDFLNTKMQILSSEMQEKKEKEKEFTIKELLDKKIIKNPWHAFFLAFDFNWFVSLGVNPKNLRARQHLKNEKSHYAEDTWDLEYKFPFGWKELSGYANRTDYDLKAHMKHSKQDLSVFDEESKEKIVPHVICEPSMGVERTFLLFMYESYTDDGRGNITLKLHPKLAPVKIAVFPLVNKLNDKAREVFEMLKNDFDAIYDKSGSIGRRYARADEIGIPYCITIDFDTLEDDSVTIRNRDTTEQKRIGINDLPIVLNDLISGKKAF